MDRISFRIATAGTPDAEPLRPNAARILVAINGQEITNQLLDTPGLLFGGEGRRTSFYLFTCSCGEAGCAGFHLLLEQRRTETQVIWSIEDEKLSGLLGASTLIFDAKSFDAARLSLHEDLKALEARGIHAEDLFDEEYVDFDEDEAPQLVAHPLDTIAAWSIAFYRGQNEMNEAIERADGPGSPVKLRFSWHATHVSIDPQMITPEVFFPMTAANIAARLLNLGESANAETQERVDEIVPVTRIIQAFAEDLDVIAAETAFLPYRRFLVRDGIHEALPFFHTDKEGPFVRFA